jgi:hypothetical protein
LNLYIINSIASHELLRREFIMVNKLRLEQFVFTAIVIFIMTGISLTAHGSSNSSAIRALAGQMCPNGSYVIGFDSEGKIICADACGNGVPNKDGDEEELAVETSAPDPGSLPPIPNPVISGVKPKSVVWGTSEVAITVIGTGFHEESVVIFEGSTYKPAVNQAGTRLDITIETANLIIGPYAIKVSNGSGLENTLKRALVVY